MRGLLLLGILFCFGCVSARMQDTRIDDAFHKGAFVESARYLKEGLKKQGENGRDKLLYLLDLGVVLHSANRYRDSTRYLSQADRLAVIRDYTSLSQEAHGLLTSENVKDYQAEEFENVLISTYLAMNYALLGEYEDALVEARRVNHKLYMMISKGKRKYQLSVFASYLAALLYESQKEYSDAYIDYKKVLKLKKRVPFLGQELWKLAWLLGRTEDRHKWEKQFKIKRVQRDQIKRALDTQMPELIVFFENGLAPRKEPDPAFPKMAKYFPTPSPVKGLLLKEQEKVLSQSFLLDDIEKMALLNYKEKYAGLLAKRIAGIAIKEGVAEAVRQGTDNEFLGALTSIVLNATDQADLRSWSLLPKELHVLRVSLAPGVHTLDFETFPIHERFRVTISLKTGEKKFLALRYVPGGGGSFFQSRVLQNVGKK